MAASRERGEEARTIVLTPEIDPEGRHHQLVRLLLDTMSVECDRESGDVQSWSLIQDRRKSM